MISQRLMGVPEVLATLETFNKRLEQEAVNAFNSSMLETATLSKKLTPVKTGYLRSRTRVEPAKLKKLLILVSLTNDTPYGPFVCFGTRYMKARDFINPAILFGKERLQARLLAIRVG